MKGSYRWGARLALLVAAGVVISLCLWSSRRSAVQTVQTGEPARASAPRQVARKSTFALQTAYAKPSAFTLDGVPSAHDYDDSPLADVMYRVLSNDHQLATFKYFHNRPLLDEASKAQYHKFLSDPSVLENVRHDLLYPEESRAELAGNVKRLMKIDYLREVLAWRENPMRSTAIALIGEMILTDNYPAGMSPDMRLSLSGNKRELYEILYENAPDRANALVQAAKGTRLEKLIDYIASSIQLRKQVESSLENEVRL